MWSKVCVYVTQGDNSFKKPSCCLVLCIWMQQGDCSSSGTSSASSRNAIRRHESSPNTCISFCSAPVLPAHPPLPLRATLSSDPDTQHHKYGPSPNCGRVPSSEWGHPSESSAANHSKSGASLEGGACSSLLSNTSSSATAVRFAVEGGSGGGAGLGVGKTSRSASISRAARRQSRVNSEQIPEEFMLASSPLSILPKESHSFSRPSRVFSAKSKLSQLKKKSKESASSLKGIHHLLHFAESAYSFFCKHLHLFFKW